MNSMTGFGRAERASAGLRIAVELRSVNHRYLDLQLRVPEPARSSEPAIRRLLGERLARGRVDLSIAVTPCEGGATAHLDVALVRHLLAQAAALSPGEAPPALQLRDVIAVPGVVRLEAAGPAWGSEAEALLLEALEEAIAGLESARREEGVRLRDALEAVLARLEATAARLEARRVPARAELLDRHRRRLEELLGDLEVDRERLAQESALLAERSDFEEELQRLRGHLAQFGAATVAAGPVGKRLEFLAQEIHRELTTLGVKCRDGELATLVLEAKLDCDRLREQAINVE